MAVPRRAFASTGNLPWATVLGLSFLALILLIPSPGIRAAGTPVGPSPAASSHLAAAMSSISSARAPAAGLSGCSLVGTAVSCLAPHSAPARATPSASGAPMPAAWTDLTSVQTSSPAARWIASMTWDPADQAVLLFGGYAPATGVDSDTWEFANDQWTQLSPSTSPAGRYGAMMAWDSTDGYAVLFGGSTSGYGVFNDTWEFKSGGWTNVTGTTTSTPEGRWRAGITWDPVDGYVLMYGGTYTAAGTSTILSDTWSFVHGNWTKITASGSPPGRFRTSMTWDTADGYAVIFGGCTDLTCTTPDASTWTYVNSTWTQVSATVHPPGRAYFGITYSPVYQHVIVWGGTTSGSSDVPLSDTWAFAGGAWSNITSNVTGKPTARAYLSLAFDVADNFTLMFAGQFSNGTYSDESWALGPSIIGRLSASPTTVDLGQRVTITSSVYAYTGYVNYNYTALPMGCTGANVSSLTCTPSATGAYPVAVELKDASGTTVNESTAIQVNSDPQITQYTITRTIVTAGVRVQFEVNVSGGTGMYGYRYAGLPPGCSNSNVHNLTCTPGSTASGPYNVTVFVNDQASMSVNETLLLTVNPPPALPGLVVVPSTLDIGGSFTAWANATHGTGPLAYSYSGLPAPCTGPNASTITCQPSATGTSTITANVTDVFGFRASSSALVIVNSDPTIDSSAILPGVIDAGSPFSLWVNASGGTGSLVITYAGGPSSCTLGNQAVATCTTSTPGTYAIRVNVTDQVGWTVSTTLTVTVNAPYTAVGLVATPTALDAGQNVSLNFSATGGTAPFTYVWSGLPAGCAPVATSPTLTCLAAHPGSLSITVVGTDHWHVQVSGHATVLVHASPAVAAFTTSAAPATTGLSFNLTVNVTGGSGVYTFVFARLPTGCTAANVSVLACTPTAPGSYNVSVTVTDSLGESASGYLLVQVTNPAPASSGSGAALSGTTMYLIIGAVVIVVAAVAALLLLRRRRSPPRGSAAAPAEEAWSEPPGPNDPATE